MMYLRKKDPKLLVEGLIVPYTTTEKLKINTKIDFLDSPNWVVGVQSELGCAKNQNPSSSATKSDKTNRSFSLSALKERTRSLL